MLACQGHGAIATTSTTTPLASNDDLNYHAQQINSPASSKMPDVLIVNPTFNSPISDGAEHQKKSLPKIVVLPKVSRRELLVRELQQRQQQRQMLLLAAPTTTAIGSRNRPLHPYFRPVPKVKAIPGPILLAKAASAKLLVKKEKQQQKQQFLGAEVNAQSTAGLWRLQLVNGGSEADGSGKGREDSNIKREKVPQNELVVEKKKKKQQPEIGTGGVTEKVERGMDKTQGNNKGRNGAGKQHDDDDVEDQHGHNANARVKILPWPKGSLELEEEEEKVEEENATAAQQQQQLKQQKQLEKAKQRPSQRVTSAVGNDATGVHQQQQQQASDEEPTGNGDSGAGNKKKKKNKKQMKPAQLVVVPSDSRTFGGQQQGAVAQPLFLPKSTVVDAQRQTISSSAGPYGIPSKPAKGQQQMVGGSSSKVLNGVKQSSSSSGTRLLGEQQQQQQPRLALATTATTHQQHGQLHQQQQQQNQQLRFFYTPSQTSVNQDFTFAANTPGLVCAYGMPVPVYSTPRKQCIPNHPLCGLAFTCLMDVHAVDGQGKPVDNWWMMVMDSAAATNNGGGTENSSSRANGVPVNNIVDRRQFPPSPSALLGSAPPAAVAVQSTAANGILGLLGLG